METLKDEKNQIFYEGEFSFDEDKTLLVEIKFAIFTEKNLELENLEIYVTASGQFFQVFKPKFQEPSKNC